MPKSNAEDIRKECAIVLKNVRPLKINLTKVERDALKSLRLREDIIILKADKGNATIVMGN